MLSTILLDILYVFIMAAMATFTKFGLPWIIEKINGIKSDALKEFIEDAICYAENRYGAKTGDDKFLYVRAAAMKWCDDHKIKIDESDLNILIESGFTLLDSMHYINKDKED